jgi:hypothetical protein
VLQVGKYLRIRIRQAAENLGFFRFFPGFFQFFRFVSKQFVSALSLLYRNREFRSSIEPKPTEDPPKQFKR